MNNENTFLWQKLQHENNLFSNRANFFLVAHALLVASISRGSDLGGFTNTAVVGLGFLMSLAWLYTGNRNINVQNEIKGQLTEPVKITEQRPSWAILLEYSRP